MTSYASLWRIHGKVTFITVYQLTSLRIYQTDGNEENNNLFKHLIISLM